MRSNNLIFARIQPWDNKQLIKAYNMLVSTCTDYKYLHYNEFLKYRDCIMITLPPAKGEHIYPTAIVGVKRSFLKDLVLDIDDLPYHCTKDDAIYEVGFIHWYDPTYDDQFEHLKNYVLTHMLNCILADKNDSHTILLKSICPESYDSSYLADAHFEIAKTKEGYEYYIRKPITQ